MACLARVTAWEQAGEGAAEGREGSEAPGHMSGSRWARAFSSTSKFIPGGGHSWSLVPSPAVVRRNPLERRGLRSPWQVQQSRLLSLSRPPDTLPLPPVPSRDPHQETRLASRPGWTRLILLICKMTTLGCSGARASVSLLGQL